MEPNRSIFQPITNIHPGGTQIGFTGQHSALGYATKYTVPVNKIFLPTYYSYSVMAAIQGYCFMEWWSPAPAYYMTFGFCTTINGTQVLIADNIHDCIWLPAGYYLQMYSTNPIIRSAMMCRGYLYDV